MGCSKIKKSILTSEDPVKREGKHVDKLDVSIFMSYKLCVKNAKVIRGAKSSEDRKQENDVHGGLKMAADAERRMHARVCAHVVPWSRKAVCLAMHHRAGSGCQ